MLADPDCVGEILLVGMGMARSLDLGDPPWTAEHAMPMRALAEALYGKRWLPTRLVGAGQLHETADSNPYRRIWSVFHADRRRYSATTDGDRPLWARTCGRPMIRREGVCGRTAAHDQQRRLTDPLTGQQRTVGACSQKACRAWLADLIERNRAELAAHPAPEPAANTGGVLERHLPEIDWWPIWAHVDKSWKPPPEGQRFERPKLRLLLGDEPPAVTVQVERPALVVHEGGWR
jgi:hypothetical protein